MASEIREERPFFASHNTVSEVMRPMAASRRVDCAVFGCNKAARWAKTVRFFIGQPLISFVHTCGEHKYGLFDKKGETWR